MEIKLPNPHYYLAKYRKLPRFLRKFISLCLIFSIVFTSGGLIYLFGPFKQEVEAVWFDDNYAFRQRITFTHNADITSDRRISVTVDTATLITNGKMQSDCDDTRFTDPNGKVLRYQLTGTCNNASTTYDVIFPKVFNGANLAYIYYGNPGATSASQDVSGVTALTPSGGAPAVATEEKAPSPTLYWKFDDATGTTAQDSTTNDLDGTINNTPTWNTEDMCLSAKCLYFDGTNNENVSRADDAKLDFAAADSFTVQAWVKRNSASSANNVILTKASGNLGTVYQGYKLYMDASGDLCFATRDGTNAEDAACTSAVDFDDDQWHLVTGAKSGTTSITLYVDGNQRAQDATIASTGSLANAGTFYVGIDQDALATEWLGFIDEVKVYSSALSATQVAANYNSKTRDGGNEGAAVRFGADPYANLANGLVGYWKEDHETTGTAATDSSGNAQTLTDSGTVAYADGKFGKAGDFENTNVDEFQYLADNATLSITGSLTLSAWIRPEIVTAGSRTIIAKWDLISGVENESYRLSQEADEIRLTIDATGNNVETSASNLAAATFYHVVGVYNASSATAKIYINGAEAATTATGTIPSSIGDDSGRFHIGGEDSSTAGAAAEYDGRIDEARVYNRALTVADVAQLYDFATGPVGYWKFEEKTGTTTADSSGNANTGTLTSGPVWTKGKIGNAIEFDGTNDYVSVADASSLDITSGGTISFWFQRDTTANWDGIISKGPSNGDNAMNYSCEIINDLPVDTIRCVIGTGTSSNTINTSTDFTTANTWNHIAFTWDGSVLLIYVNGIRENVTTTQTITPAANTSTLRVGVFSDDATPADPYDGKIDDVKVYNYARAPKQILEDMNATAPVTSSPISGALAYWKFNEGFGTTAQDSSQNNFDGTLSNASWTNAGKFGKAWNGDGTNRVTVADNDAFDVIRGADSLTLSLWLKSDSATNPSAQEEVFNKWAAGVGPGWAIYFQTDGDIVFGIDDDATAFPEDSVGTTLSNDIYDATWHHVVAVKNGTSRLDLYIDGRLRSSDTSISSTTGLENGNAIFIGDGEATDDGFEFNGDIDEVKMYQGVLNASDVLKEYNRSSAQVLGALSDDADFERQAAAQEYCVPGDTSCTSTASSPAGEWKFEEKTGTTAQDTSTNGNSGSISGAAWTNGRLGAALDYDGTDDVTTVTNATAIDLNTNTAHTFSVWIYADSAGEGSGGQVYNKGSTTFLRVDTLSGSNLDVEAQLDLATTDATLNIATAITTGTWNHIAVSYADDADDEITIYVNGVNKGSSTNGVGSIAADANNLLIGGPTTDNFDGKIDQFRFYGYERSTAQIAYDYNRGAPVAHWKMDECQGTTINDSAGNSLTGTLTIGGTGGNTAVGTCTTSGAWFDGATGKRNYSMDVDGTDDYINVPDNTLLRPNNESWSVAVWANPANSNQNGPLITKRQNANPFEQWGLFICGDTGCDTTGQVLNALFIESSDAPVQRRAISTADVADGNWHQYVMVADKTAGSVKIYMDGKELAATITSNGSWPTIDNTDALRIGNDNGTRYFTGQIDDARVYNYALTATQIKTLYTDGAARFGPTTGAP